MSTNPSTDRPAHLIQQADPAHPSRATAAAERSEADTHERDWNAAADWAESATVADDGLILPDNDPMGPTYGADLLRRAGVGRPPLDPSTPAGQNSRSRPVRLGRELDHQLDDYLSALATEGKRTNASEIIRTALQVYLADHGAHQHTA